MPVRLAIVGLPKLLADLIVAAFTEDDALQIDELPDDAAVDLSAGGRLRYDAIIVGVTDPWRSPLMNQITAVARPLLLGVRTDGRESWIYRMQPRPQRLGPTSPTQIRAAVLAGAGNPTAAPSAEAGKTTTD